MAYRRSGGRTRKRSGRNFRSGRASFSRRRVRQGGRRSFAARGSRRGGHQTVRLVIQHAPAENTGVMATPTGLVQSAVNAQPRRARF